MTEEQGATLLTYLAQIAIALERQAVVLEKLECVAYGVSVWYVGERTTALFWEEPEPEHKI